MGSVVNNAFNFSNALWCLEVQFNLVMGVTPSGPFLFIFSKSVKGKASLVKLGMKLQ